MGVTLRSMIIASVLIIGAALLYSLSGTTGRLSDDEISSRFPTFTATNFRGELYNDQGQISYSLFAEDLSFYKVRNEINATGLVGFWYEHERGDVRSDWQYSYSAELRQCQDQRDHYSSSSLRSDFQYH